MRCLRARRSATDVTEGVLALKEGDVVVHINETEPNGWHVGVCNGVVGFYWPDDVIATELPASSDDVAIFLEVQHDVNQTGASHRHTSISGKRDSTASVISASSSSATAATVKTGRDRSLAGRPSFTDPSGELASFLHSERGADGDTDVRRARVPDSIQSLFYSLHSNAFSRHHSAIWRHPRPSRSCNGTPPAAPTTGLHLLPTSAPSIPVCLMTSLTRLLVAVFCDLLMPLQQLPG